MCVLVTNISRGGGEKKEWEFKGESAIYYTCQSVIYYTCFRTMLGLDDRHVDI